MSEVDVFLAEIEKIEKIFQGKIKRLVLQEISRKELIILAGELDFFKELINAGYLKSLDKFLKNYEDTIVGIIQRAKQEKINVSTATMRDLERLNDLDGAWLLRRGQEYSEQYKSALLKNIISGTPTKDLVNDLLPEINKSIVFKANWLDTALHQSYTAMQNVSYEKAFEEAPETKFVLNHPLDINTRRLCKYAIEKMKEYPSGLTIKQINGGYLDKGFNKKTQSENDKYSFINVGGFNCRGFWKLK